VRSRKSELANSPAERVRAELRAACGSATAPSSSAAPNAGFEGNPVVVPSFAFAISEHGACELYRLGMQRTILPRIRQRFAQNRIPDESSVPASHLESRRPQPRSGLRESAPRSSVLSLLHRDGKRRRGELHVAGGRCSHSGDHQQLRRQLDHRVRIPTATCLSCRGRSSHFPIQ
jgi:hypothetical protein